MIKCSSARRSEICPPLSKEMLSNRGFLLVFEEWNPG